MIQLEWIYGARSKFEDEQLRSVMMTTGAPALGVDVANSERGDEACIVFGRGGVVESVEAFRCPNANELGTRVAHTARERLVDARHIGVDGVGVGAGTVNELRRLGLRCSDLQGGSKMVTSYRGGIKTGERFNNLRSQMYYELRLDLQDGLLALPNDDELIADLTTPDWETKNGMIIVESKEEIKKRLGRSPNKGDALVYWNWARKNHTPISATIADHQSATQTEQSLSMAWADGQDYERTF